MDFSKYFNRTWELFQNHLSALIIETIVFVIVSAITLGILSPVMQAGYTRSLLRMILEDRKPETGDLFSEMSHFFPLLGLIILVVLAVTIGFVLLVIPGLLLLFLILLIQQYFFQFLVTEKKGVFHAARSSWNFIFSGGRTGDHIVIMLLVLLFHSAGGSVFLGLIVTVPLSMIFLSLVFVNEAAGTQNNSKNYETREEAPY